MCPRIELDTHEQTTRRRGFLSPGPNVEDYGKEAVKKSYRTGEPRRPDGAQTPLRSRNCYRYGQGLSRRPRVWEFNVAQHPCVDDS